MSIELYRELTRYISCGVFTFFMYHAVMGMWLSRFHREKYITWHFLLCLGTAIYACALFFNTSSIGFANGDQKIAFCWILGFGSYFCYLKAMENYLELRSKLLGLAKLLAAILIFMQIMNFALNFFGGVESFLTTRVTGREKTLFENAFYLERTSNTIGYFVSIMGATAIGMATYAILQGLKASPRPTGLLKFGAFATLISATNDTLLGAGFLGSVLPIYYLGNVVETIRLHQTEQSTAQSQIHRLEKEALLAKLSAEEGKRYQKLLRTLSHDINNALAIITGTVRKSLKREEIDEKSRSGLERVQRASGHISKIIQTILAQEVGKSSAQRQFQWIDLESIYDELRFVFSDQLQTKGLSLEFDPVHKCPRFMADPHILIHQILGNVISNAIKFSPRGGKIRVSYKVDNRTLRLFVRDHGPGIDAQKIEELWNDESVASQPGSEGEGGHGFGLRIVKENIEAFGGKVRFVDASSTKEQLPDVGTGENLVSLEFPLAS